MKQIRAHGHGYANVECCSEEKKNKGVYVWTCKCRVINILNVNNEKYYFFSKKSLKKTIEENYKRIIINRLV